VLPPLIPPAPPPDDEPVPLLPSEEQRTTPEPKPQPGPTPATPRSFPAVTVVLGAAAVIASLWWWADRERGEAFEMTYRAFEDQPWRLFTSTLLHLDIFHLAFNLYWLARLGRALEERWGSRRTLGVILLFAAGSSAAEYAYTAGGVGLSGVGYGLFGLIWILGQKDDRFRRVLTRGDVWLFVAWFFLCIYRTEHGGWLVANYAHGAGLVLGGLLGLAIRSTGTQRRLWLAVEAFALIYIGLAATVGRGALNRSPNVGVDLARDGYEHLMAGDKERGVELYERAVRLNPRQADWWYTLGFGYEQLDRWDTAAAAYERTVTLSPTPANRSALARARYGAGTKQLEGGNAAEALPLLKGAIEVDGGNADAWHNLGFAYAQLGQNKEALAAFERAAQLQPNDQSHQQAVEWLRQRLP
jgi:membrane associated rhomboid family serine protease